jgi:hypothetical protein
MLRFMANQVSPPPSDVWRFASSGATQVTILENVLSRVPAKYIADALLTLPDPEIVSERAIMNAFVDVPGIGRVRITARRMKHRRGQSTHYFWTAESAVIAE